MADCFVCKKTLARGELVTVKAKGVRSLIVRASARGHEENERFLQTVSEVTIHTSCHKHYSDSRLDNSVRRRSDSSSSSSSEAPQVTFDFKNNCFICSESVNTRLNRNKNCNDYICIVRKATFKNTIYECILYK